MNRSSSKMGWSGERSCGDLLLIPMGTAGHVNPLMYVVKGLISQGQGRLTATMLLEEGDQDLMKPHLEDEETTEGFRLELVASAKKGASISFLDAHNDFGRQCDPFLRQVLAEQQAGGEGPRCMIADQFMGWSEVWATKLQIPRYVIIPSPATYGYCLYNLSILTERDKLLERRLRGEDPILNLPGILTIRLRDLSKMTATDPEFFTSNGDTYGQADGLLMNTFYELEASAIDAFDAQLKTTFGEKRPKLFSIGPMLPPEFFREDTFKGNASDSGCIQWLDGRPPSSVLYIAFGSQCYLPERQIQELANALEASAVSFLWVLRVDAQPPDGRAKGVSALLPPGFQERTKDRGLVYSLYAPQLRILSHPATSGFLSHCGWNSSLESICRGVPMIGWPLQAEQRACCRVLEQAGLMVPVRPVLTSLEELVKSDEVQKALRILMLEPEGKKLKTRALELQGRARAAVASTGSSIQNIEELMHDIQCRSTRIHHNQL